MTDGQWLDQLERIANVLFELSDDADRKVDSDGELFHAGLAFAYKHAGETIKEIAHKIRWRIQ